MHNETDCTYQDRQRQEIFNLCMYLRARKKLLPEQDHHFLNKELSFFFQSSHRECAKLEKKNNHWIEALTRK